MDGSEERSAHGLVQIGDLARRVGVRVDTLRAWERRYGLLNPHRSTGGFRLYSSDDEAIVRAMTSEIDRGYPPAQAAKLALARAGSPAGQGDGIAAALDPSARTSPTDGPHLAALRTELYRALLDFDGGRAHQLLDELFAEFTLNAVLRDVLLPCLQQIGDGWADGDVTIAEEHFASQLIRDRLLGLARAWDQGRGPRALLACPAGERHDIGLICFGLVLSRSGWRITFLGPDTPVTALAEAAAAVSPDLIVLTATSEERFSSISEPLHAVAAGADLLLAGPGATPEVASATGATLVDDAPVSAALRIAARSPRAAHRGTEATNR
jgi:DNA-binding transcriptional MerR regulator/methylmalonyl-CoA mutase cobalamin-binding subunit